MIKYKNTVQEHVWNILKCTNQGLLGHIETLVETALVSP